MRAGGSPIPGGVLSAFSALSPSPSAGAAQACGEVPPASVATAMPCDLDMLEVTVATEDESVTVIVPGKADGLRSRSIDIACGVRPLANAGSGETADKKKLQLKRNPARISVTASYAATCGQHLHPGITITPQGNDKDICAPRKLGATTTQFEAFRLPTGVEKGKVWLKGGSLLPAVGAIWDCVDDDTGAGTVVVSSDSCGIRGAGPTVTRSDVTVRLHAEDEVSIEFRMPALIGGGYDSEEDEKEDPPKFTDTRLGRAQKVTHELQEAGYEFTFSHNGDEFGLEEIQSALSFMEACLTLRKTLGVLRKMWLAGPSVEVAVGWFGKWEISCLQSSGKASWTRKFKGGQVERTIEGNASAILVDGSATGGCGVKVKVKKLYVTWIEVDYTLALKIAGSIAGTTQWSARRIGDGKWSSEPRRRTISGEMKLTFTATGKCALCGRVIGTELAVASGIQGEGVLDPRKGFAFQQAEVKRDPVVLSVSVWVGSTGEVDYHYEQELFAEKGLYTYPRPATRGASGSW